MAARKKIKESRRGGEGGLLLLALVAWGRRAWPRDTGSLFDVEPSAVCPVCLSVVPGARCRCQASLLGLALATEKVVTLY